MGPARHVVPGIEPSLCACLSRHLVTELSHWPFNCFQNGQQFLHLPEIYKISNCPPLHRHTLHVFHLKHVFSFLTTIVNTFWVLSKIFLWVEGITQWGKALTCCSTHKSQDLTPIIPHKRKKQIENSHITQKSKIQTTQNNKGHENIFLLLFWSFSLGQKSATRIKVPLSMWRPNDPKFWKMVIFPLHFTSEINHMTRCIKYELGAFISAAYLLDIIALPQTSISGYVNLFALVICNDWYIIFVVSLTEFRIRQLLSTSIHTCWDFPKAEQLNYLITSGKNLAFYCIWSSNFSDLVNVLGPLHIYQIRTLTQNICIYISLHNIFWVFNGGSTYFFGLLTQLDSFM